MFKSIIIWESVGAPKFLSSTCQFYALASALIALTTSDTLKYMHFKHDAQLSVCVKKMVAETKTLVSLLIHNWTNILSLGD